MVVYNGNTYKTLADWDKNDSGVSCQSQFYKIPDGWSIANESQDSRYVIGNSYWKTHVLVVSTGNAYWNKSYMYNGHHWSSNILRLNENNEYGVGNCALGILLIKKNQIYFQ